MEDIIESIYRWLGVCVPDMSPLKESPKYTATLLKTYLELLREKVETQRCISEIKTLVGLEEIRLNLRDDWAIHRLIEYSEDIINFCDSKGIQPLNDKYRGKIFYFEGSEGESTIIQIDEITLEDKKPVWSGKGIILSSMDCVSGYGISIHRYKEAYFDEYDYLGDEPFEEWLSSVREISLSEVKEIIDEHLEYGLEEI